MANWDDTLLICSNPEVVKKAALAIRWVKGYNNWKEGDTKFYGTTVGCVPFMEVIEISKQFPDDVITCEYSIEVDRWSEIHTIEYRNGESELIGISPSYMLGTIPLKNNEDIDGIHNRAIAFCRRLDLMEMDKDGRLFINWFDKEVCLKFEYDGVDGKKYKVEATKCREYVDFKIYEGLIKYDWRELSKEDDLPF